MDAIEKAIRNAFEKGNAEDRAFREKVYRSAFAALDRALQANPGVTVENAIRRRKAMQAKIAEIESEFLPAVAASPVAVSPVDAGGAGAGAAPAVDSPATGAAPSAVPSVDAPGSVPPQGEGAVAGDPRGVEAVPSARSPVPDIRLEPALAGAPVADAGTVAEVAPDRDERRARRRRFPLGLVVGLLLLAAVGYGLWWALANGVLRLPERSGQTAPPVAGEASAPPAGGGAPQAPGAADQNRNWITVFTPTDPALVSAPSDAKAEVMKDDSGAFLRVRSGASGSAVSFDVGQGILEQVAGKHAVFDVIARAEDGKDTQMSIDCNFGELGDCGRKRYAVTQQKNEYLFEVEFPDKRPGAAGTIAVNSDFDRQGKSVDIYEIRVSVSE